METPTAKSIFLKATLLSLFFAGMMLLITALAALSFGYHKLNLFTKKANTSISELKSVINTGINKTPEQTNGYKTILLLGVDTVVNKPNSPQLTDTILLISINMQTGKVNLLPLPRDLWSYAYKTRVNALYEYGKDKFPDRPEQFPEEVLEELIGIDINHTVTLSLETVANIIDTVGGIDITVEKGFTDQEFPREDVDLKTVETSDELYETVVFNPGLQHMDGRTTLKYIRSRKSANIEEGTDLARSQRQQQVIDALVSKMFNFSVLKNTSTLANLYLIYDEKFENQFSKIEVVSTLNHLFQLKNELTLTSHGLSVYPENKNGVITNPPLYKYNGQWVYEIVNLEKFQDEIKNLLQS